MPLLEWNSQVEKDVQGPPAQQDMEDIVVAGIIKDQNIEYELQKCRTSSWILLLAIQIY